MHPARLQETVQGLLPGGYPQRPRCGKAEVPEERQLFIGPNVQRDEDLWALHPSQLLPWWGKEGKLSRVLMQGAWRGEGN